MAGYTPTWRNVGGQLQGGGLAVDGLMQVADSIGSTGTALKREGARRYTKQEDLLDKNKNILRSGFGEIKTEAQLNELNKSGQLENEALMSKFGGNIRQQDLLDAKSKLVEEVRQRETAEINRTDAIGYGKVEQAVASADGDLTKLEAIKSNLLNGGPEGYGIKNTAKGINRLNSLTDKAEDRVEDEALEGFVSEYASIKTPEGRRAFANTFADKYPGISATKMAAKAEDAEQLADLRYRLTPDEETALELRTAEQTRNINYAANEAKQELESVLAANEYVGAPSAEDEKYTKTELTEHVKKEFLGGISVTPYGDLQGLDVPAFINKHSTVKVMVDGKQKSVPVKPYMFYRALEELTQYEIDGDGKVNTKGNEINDEPFLAHITKQAQEYHLPENKLKRENIAQARKDHDIKKFNLESEKTRVQLGLLTGKGSPNPTIAYNKDLEAQAAILREAANSGAQNTVDGLEETVEVPEPEPSPVVSNAERLRQAATPEQRQADISAMNSKRFFGNVYSQSNEQFTRGDGPEFGAGLKAFFRDQRIDQARRNLKHHSDPKVRQQAKLLLEELGASTET